MGNPASSADWRAAEALLDQLLDLEAEERQQALKQLTDSGVIRACVLDLLAALQRPGLLDRGNLAFLPDTISAALPDLSGQIIDRYRLESLIGRGGMSAVYRARRTDGAFDQPVAIKLLSAALLSTHWSGQFQREVRFLARLRHANIAALLDAGILPDGTPWMATEFIDGIQIDRYCDPSVPVRTRVELVRDLCRAVAFAQSNLIVHRDIKPDNVLVTPDGRVVLLDFGIARALNADGDPENLARMTRVFTPQYAAPEQLAGEPVTTATDVFAIGAVLFKLLTGRAPFDGAIHRPGDGLTGPPSRELGSNRQLSGPERRQLQRAIRGDLDNIVQKALAPEPDRRYASAQALADDLDRHLSGLPVLARRASMAYRAGKFVQRHRIGVGLSSLAVLGLCAALVWSTIQTQRAEAALARANAVQSFLIEVFNAAEPAPGARGMVTQRELAERAIARLDQVLLDQPDMATDVLIAISRIFRQLGFPEQSMASLARVEAQLGNQGADEARALKVELRRLQGQVAIQAGDARAGTEFLEQALKLAEASDQAAWLRAELWWDLGFALSNLRELDRALAKLERAEALALKTPEAAELLPRIQLHRALTLRRAGQLEKAIEAGLIAVESARHTYGDHDARLASALSTVGGMHRRAGRLEMAKQMLREALEIDIAGSGQPNAATVNNLANALVGLGRLDEARELYQQAISLAAGLFGPDSPRAVSYRRNFARFQLHVGEIEPALETIREAEAIYAAAYEPGDTNLINMRNDLALALLEAGLIEEAESVLTEVINQFEAARGPGGHLWRRTQVLSTWRALEAGDLPTARHHLALSERDLGPYELSFSDRVRLEILAGDIALAGGQPDQAYTRWNAAKVIAAERLYPDHPVAAKANRRLRSLPAP